MPRITPAGVAWAVILGEAAAVDIVLLRRGHLPLSTVCRRSKIGRALALALALHLVATVPGDPLTVAGHYLSKRDRHA